MVRRHDESATVAMPASGTVSGLVLQHLPIVHPPTINPTSSERNGHQF